MSSKKNYFKEINEESCYDNPFKSKFADLLHK